MVLMMSNNNVFTQFYHTVQICSLQVIGDWTSSELIDIGAFSHFPVVLNQLDQFLPIPTFGLKKYKSPLDKSSNSSFLDDRSYHHTSQKCRGKGVVSIIFTDWFRPYYSDSTVPILLRIRTIINYLSISSVNPRYIFIQLHPNHLIPVGNYKGIPLNFNMFSVTSIFLTFYQSLIHWMCINCRNRPQLYELQSNVIQSQLNEQLTMRRSFDGGFVRIMSDDLLEDESTGCSFYHNNLKTPPIYCSLVTLQKLHNFTASAEKLTKLDPRLLTRLVGFVMTRSTTDSFNLFVNTFRYRIEWVLHAISYQPYEFVVITDSLVADPFAMLSPFDKWMWIGTLSSAFGFIFTCIIILRFSKMVELIFQTFAEFLQQSDQSSLRSLFGNIEWKLFLLVCPWLYGVNLLSVTYQGSLFSCLITSVPPYVPETLDELIVNNNFPLITSGGDGWSEVKDEWVSNLIQVIIPDLMNGLDPSNELYKQLSRLKTAAIVISGDPFSIIRNISLNLPIFQEETGTPVSLSRTFAILNPKELVEEILAAVNLFFSESTMIIRNHDMNSFMKRSPWVATRNDFHSKLSVGLAALSGSGIFDRWDRHEFIHTQLESITDAASELEEQRESWDIEGNLYARFMLADLRTIKFGEAKHVSLHVLRLPFFICDILYMIGIIGFLFEIMRFYSKHLLFLFFRLQMVVTRAVEIMIQFLRNPILFIKNSEFRKGYRIYPHYLYELII